ncbi:RNA-binding S4 domain-containing protein [Alicyclobacillus mengziensis]|uniref:RQC P-site tRNA stabilizing factor n=1 Tax=Alicyclobacillus mengziensis TaxID=2931921 RepID=A0A9X7W060_9BACL|nr:RNA-binding S4 domain-containing protein [Alicyclobacillus mengziensis]QSO47939.1 RNA-binding S4 domain-containing protein [Alicyclobacillus mengziensis]
MRLDKFLKASRLIKRRTVAKEVADAGRISVNGRVAKAGTEVAVGDTITIRYASRTVEVRALLLTENPRKEAAEEMYELISDSGREGNLEANHFE